MADITYTITYYGGSTDHQAFVNQDIDWCGAVEKQNNRWFRTCEIKIFSSEKLASLSVNLNFTLMYLSYQYAMRFYYELTQNKITNIRYGRGTDDDLNVNYYKNNNLQYFTYQPEDPECTSGTSNKQENRIWINLYDDNKNYYTGIGLFSNSETDMSDSKWTTIRTQNFTITNLPSNPIQENNKFIYYLYIYGFNPPNLYSYAWNITNTNSGYEDYMHGAIKIKDSTTFSGEPAEPEFDPQLDIFNTNYTLTEYIKPGNDNNQNFRGLYARLTTYQANQDQETASIIFPTKYSAGNIITAANHNDILQSIKTLANSIAYNKTGLTYPTNASTFSTSANYTDATERQKCWNFVKNTAITQNNIIYDLEPYYVVINCIGWSNIN